MIAKLIVRGDDRGQALARLDAALRDTHIVGLHTNVAFLRRIAGTRAFATADLDTALIEREHDALFDAPPLPEPVAAAGLAALTRAEEAALEGPDPWSRRDGWRLVGGARRRFDVILDAEPRRWWLERRADGGWWLQVGDQTWPFAATGAAGRFDVVLGAQRLRLAVYRCGERVAVFADAGSRQFDEVDPIAHAGDHAGEAGRLTAPMPGKVVAFLAAVGERVRRGQPLAVMEAMKMEHTIAAPRDGTVEALLYGVGDQVAEGGELLRMTDA